MRISDIVKKLEDVVIASTKVIVADSKAACNAIKANHVKAEEPKVEPQAKDEVQI